MPIRLLINVIHLTFKYEIIIFPFEHSKILGLLGLFKNLHGAPVQKMLTGSYVYKVGPMFLARF
jgi:hypothetical protein